MINTVKRICLSFQGRPGNIQLCTISASPVGFEIVALQAILGTSMNLSFEPKERSLKHPEASMFTQDLFNSKQGGKSFQVQFPIIALQIEFRIKTIKF